VQSYYLRRTCHYFLGIGNCMYFIKKLSISTYLKLYTDYYLKNKLYISELKKIKIYKKGMPKQIFL
jgi:hypothetical protein